MIPSSDQIASDSRSNCSRIRRPIASPHAAWTRAPYGLRTHRRQSPISSRKRSMTIVRSRRDDARRGLLLGEEVDQVAGRALVEVVVGWQRLGAGVDGPRAERADRPAELLRAPDAVALPERHRAGDAGCGGDDHAVAADLLDPPRRGAEQERLARSRLVDHLLVELADAAPVGQRDHEQPAVGDRAGVGDRELARALAGADRPGDAVPDDPRAQLGELGRRVAAVEHVEDVLEQRAPELGERVGAGDEGVQLVDADRLRIHGRGHRDDLLGEHVERVASARRSARSRRRASSARRPRTRRRSARNLGKIRPLETSPTPWPARPMR